MGRLRLKKWGFLSFYENWVIW